MVYADYAYYSATYGGMLPKVGTGRALSYHGAPRRGKQWDKRMWADRGKEVVKTIAKSVGGRPK